MNHAPTSSSSEHDTPPAYQWCWAWLAVLVVSDLWLEPGGWLAVASSSPPGVVLQGRMDMFAYGVFAITLVLICRSWRRARDVVQNGWFVLPALGLAVFSLVISQDPGLTGAALVRLLGATAIGVFIAAQFTLRNQLVMLGFFFAGLITLNLGAFLFFPEQAIAATGPHAGHWLGLFGNKNYLGRLMVFALAVFAVLACADQSSATWRMHAGGRKSVAVLGAVGAAVLMLGSGSKGALVAAVAMSALMVSRALRDRFRARHVWTLGLSGVAVIAVVFVASGWLAEALHDGQALNNRIKLWSLLAANVRDHPWLGHGYGAFWQGDRGASGEVSAWMYFYPNHAHNGFVDLALQLGSAGLVLLLTPMLILADHAVRWGFRHDTLSDFWPALFLSGFLLINQPYSILMGGHFYWALYVAVGLTLIDRGGRFCWGWLYRDLAIAAACLWAAIATRYAQLTPDMASFWWMFPVAAIASGYCLHLFGAYERGKSRFDVVKRVVMAVTVAALTVAIAQLLTGASGFPRSATALFWLFATLSLALVRLSAPTGAKS